MSAALCGLFSGEPQARPRAFLIQTGLARETPPPPRPSYYRRQLTALSLFTSRTHSIFLFCMTTFLWARNPRPKMEREQGTRIVAPQVFLDQPRSHIFQAILYVFLRWPVKRELQFLESPVMLAFRPNLEVYLFEFRKTSFPLFSGPTRGSRASFSGLISKQKARLNIHMAMGPKPLRSIETLPTRSSSQNAGVPNLILVNFLLVENHGRL